ncbi:protein translocase subunit SecD [Corynebacterium uterequi]|uniref:Protein translocase subunit SecD n=1 Tax=Corynebacterium uterequi TaxID=1072256 RepID=A0A0G3HET7_9CORY|nr:protein translocase subunit SecD [Corynebacterium uterequi]AKK11235.1 protein-export membrane protein, SecD/SecF family [Corynebacterium uterequi]
MAAQERRTGGAGHAKRAWPKRAIGLFILILATVYGLIFLTGDKSLAPRLGIDLQGGTRITLVPQGDNPTPEQLSQARTILENRVNGMGVSGAEVVADGSTLVITVPGEDASQAQAVGQTSQLLFRPVAQPGLPDVLSMPTATEEMANRWVEHGILTPEEAQAGLDKLVSGLNALLKQQDPAAEEIATPQVSAQPPAPVSNAIEAGDRREEQIEVLLADRQSSDPTVQAAASSLLVCTPDRTDPLAGTDDPAKPLVTCDPANGQPYVLEPAPLLSGVTDEDGPRLTGDQIDADRPITGGYNPETGQMEISFSFETEGKANGSATWAELTTENLQEQVAITLDSQVISAPVIQSATPYGSATSITGDFTQEEATALANNLRYGALPLSFAGENGEPGGTTQTIPPQLGAAALKAGIIAGLVGFALIAVYVFFYYRLFGLISLVTLALATALSYGLIVLLGRWIGYSLDLAGVAGLIIGLGTTADSFVVYYERIKDEIRAGRTVRSAVHRGWDRAKQTIVTGNVVTLIGAVVVYALAVGEVRGFAFTLGLMTIFDILVTFLITAPLAMLAVRSRFWSKGSVNGLGAMIRYAEAQRERQRADGAVETTNEEN